MSCGRGVKPTSLFTECPFCGGILLPEEAEVPTPKPSKGIWVWGDGLLVRGFKSRVTLMEGNTPLLPSRTIRKELGVRRLWFKDESRNPTGTFIDRGAASLLSAARSLGYRKLIVASSGDLGISIAQYGRVAGLSTKVYVAGTAPTSKVYRTILLADSVTIKDSYQDAVKSVERLKPSDDVAKVTSRNPFLIDGYRTLWYEVLREIKSVSSEDAFIVPVGDGALLTSLYLVMKQVGRIPSFFGVRACRDTPLIKDIYSKKPLLQDLIKEIIEESRGEILEVCEEEVLTASILLMREEGISAGPVSSAPVAAMLKEREFFRGRNKVVAILTGDPFIDVALLRRMGDYIYKKGFRYGGLGYTKTKILEIISLKGPIHPYGVWKALRKEYSVSIGLRAVYQHIDELTELGAVEVVGEEIEKERRRKLYKLTSKGLEYIK